MCFGHQLELKIVTLSMLVYLIQKTEKDKVCFGRSEIHGWGLFARRNILEGEMVIR